MHYMPAFKCNRILNISGGKPGHFQIEAANLSILGIKGVILCEQGGPTVQQLSKLLNALKMVDDSYIRT